MPRKARIDAPDALHHIMIRGIERRAIFRDSRDYEAFLARLGRVLGETSTSCYAWTTMPNHVHLLLRTGTMSLSSVMRRVLTGYALEFNRRHKRYGHLYQNRYKSILCEEDPYFLELVRYVHLNPLRAGIAKDLDELETVPTTGHGVVMGRAVREWQDVDYVLGFFGGDRKVYRSYVSEGIITGSRPDLTGGGLVRSQGGWTALKRADVRTASDERILGSGDFVTSVLKAADETYEKRAMAVLAGLTVEKLILVVAERIAVDSETVKSPSKERGAARAKGIICCLARDHLGMNGVEIGRRLGLTPSAVCKSVQRGRTDPLLREISQNVLATTTAATKRGE